MPIENKVSYLILSYLILSYLIFYLILSYLILSYFILSYLILSYLILSYLILSYLILSYLYPCRKVRSKFSLELPYQRWAAEITGEMSPVATNCYFQML